MNKPTRKIEVDESTATTLEIRAAERGTSVSDLVSELMLLADEPVDVPDEELAEFDRRWAAIHAGEQTVPHEEVARWLKTWGTPDFKPWRDR